jgi:hypothetical protein
VARRSLNPEASPGLMLIKAALIRGDAVERVTRIELAWPAWKVTVHVLEGGPGAVPARSWLTLDDCHSPCVMAR